MGYMGLHKQDCTVRTTPTSVDYSVGVVATVKALCAMKESPWPVTKSNCTKASIGWLLEVTVSEPTHVIGDLWHRVCGSIRGRGGSQ